MNRLILLILAFSIGCSSYQEASDGQPARNCGSDINNTYELCNIKLPLKSGDLWSYENYLTIEEYTYTVNKAKRTEFQIIVSLSLNNFAYYNSAFLVVDSKSYTLTARKTGHDETRGLREIIYFNVTRDFINVLAESHDILLLMPGKVTNRYRVRSSDIPAIKEFYDSL